VPDRLKPAGLRYLAGMMLEAGEPEAALRTYENSNAEEADPDFQSRLLFAQAYMGTRRFAPALDLLNRLRTEQPGNVDVIVFTITALYYLGRFQESADLAREASQKEPGDPVTAAMAVRSLRALGDTAAAEQYQKRAMILLASAAPYNQACILAILGQTADALAKLSLAAANDRSVVPLARLDPDLLELRDTPAFEAALAVPSQAAAG
jgi:tetratricopeptide (TPR) repeat protein